MAPGLAKIPPMFWDSCSKKILGKTQQAISTTHVQIAANGMVITLLGSVFSLD